MQQPSAATGWLWGLDLPPSVRQGWQPIWTGNGWGDIWLAKSRPQHKDSGGRGRAGVGTPKAVRSGRTRWSCGGNWSKRMWELQWGRMQKIKLQVKKGGLKHMWTWKGRELQVAALTSSVNTSICVWGRGGREERSIIVPPADVMLNFKAAPSISNNNPSKGCNEHTHTGEQARHVQIHLLPPELAEASLQGLALWRSSVHRQESVTNNCGKEGRRYPFRGLAQYPSHRRGEGEGSLDGHAEAHRVLLLFMWFNQQWSSTCCKFVIAGMSLALTTYLHLKLYYRIG